MVVKVNSAIYLQLYIVAWKEWWTVLHLYTSDEEGCSLGNCVCSICEAKARWVPWHIHKLSDRHVQGHCMYMYTVAANLRQFSSNKNYYSKSIGNPRRWGGVGMLWALQSNVQGPQSDLPLLFCTNGSWLQTWYMPCNMIDMRGWLN